LKPSDDATFFEGRRVDIMFNDKKVGVMGIIHPDVLHNFRIPFPCSAFEMFIEPFI
jgi:phenylalanyl-tRNA synthetase beta chain